MRMLIRARVRRCSPPLSTSFSEIPWRSHASIRSGRSDPLQCMRSRSNHEAAECVTDRIVAVPSGPLEHMRLNKPEP